VRLRMFRRSTHAAFRARSFCDHWRGDYLARRQQTSSTGRVSGPICSSAQREKRSRPPAAAFGQRRQLAQLNCCGQRKRQRRLNSEVMRANQSAACCSLASDRPLGFVPPTCSSTPSYAWLPVSIARVPCSASRSTAVPCDCWGDALDRCCLLRCRRRTGAAFVPHEHRFLSLGCGRLSPTGNKCDARKRGCQPF